MGEETSVCDSEKCPEKKEEKKRFLEMLVLASAVPNLCLNNTIVLTV